MTTTVIICDCKVCNGKAAEVPEGSQYETLAAGDTETAKTARHNVVLMAHMPLLRNASRDTRPHGPWAA